MSNATCEFSDLRGSTLPGAQIIAETLERLRGERGDMEQFLESMLSSLEDVGSRLSKRQSHLAEHEAKLNEREQQLAQRQAESEQLRELLQSQAGRLESMAGELQAVREELNTKITADDNSGESAHLQGVVQRLEEQRDDLKQRLDVCREELARRNDATEQLAKSQVQLASAREEILELREKIEQRRELGEGDIDEQRERVALETELEMVRRRAAELSETLAEQKDQMTHQQAMWSAELNHLRHLMDAHNGAWINQAANHPPATEQAAQDTTPTQTSTQPPPEQPASTASAPPAAGGDPVVNSIMQQFAKLQQDVAQRRKRSNS